MDNNEVIVLTELPDFRQGIVDRLLTGLTARNYCFKLGDTELARIGAQNWLPSLKA